MAPPVCPECKNGKHQNCDGVALNENDTLDQCACEETGHGFYNAFDVAIPADQP